MTDDGNDHENDPKCHASYVHTIDALERMVESLRGRQGFCSYCTGQALILGATDLLSDAYGPERAAEVCEQIAGTIRLVRNAVVRDRH
jgi:hypothetical protein